ncbi:MAG: alpha/beta fold hydrolase [Rhodospirillaceae bacterium]
METRTQVLRTYIDGLFGQMHLRLTSPKNPCARPLLCIHVSPLSGIVYEKFLGEIGTDRIAIAPDTPGYGMSDGPCDAPNIETYAFAMTRLLDDLKFETADIMGYGTGSKIAFQTALDNPDRIKHVTLISAPDYTAEEAAQMRTSLGRVIEPVKDGSHLLANWAQVEGFSSTQLRMRVFPDHIRAGARKPWGPRAAFAFRYRDRIDELKPPLLVININNEITVPTRRLSEVLQMGTYVERMDWRHGFLDQSPAAVAKLVRDFVDS